MQQLTAPKPKIATPPLDDIATQLRRRRAAANRLTPMPCGHQDPLDCLTTPNGPSTYGLTEDELRAHARQLLSWGWSAAEVLTRLAVQPRQEMAA